MATLVESQFKQVAESFGGKSFSTYDYILAFQDAFPAVWVELEEEYGTGGQGAGTHYSSFSRVAHYLNELTKKGYLDKLDYRPAPDGWGNPIIRYWSLSAQAREGQDFPDELPQNILITEGAKRQILVNTYERDSTARQKCIDKWGVKCSACGLDFEKKYGVRGAGFIHVHHLKPISQIGKEYTLDPANDLRPLCPNCHAMIHRSSPIISIDELKEVIKPDY
ncbi:HNH endonuclease [Desulfocurvibacter africanus]|uniref:HNH endonuclease n=1 Tax=Desulfocurvibacter africanus TaxID=873 RepID=UPI001B7FD818|nr:HNH endonuclease [Desulfocurvibacter africanus]